jgi:L-ascorbate metabolism protein UlaG (beta-lactamase superfamily)
MELQFYGANCIRLTTKKASIVIDDNLVDLGLKSVTKPGDIALFTAAHGEVPNAKLVFDQPGEYEASDISIQGISTRAHIDETGQHTATMFKLLADDIRVAVLRHIYPSLSNDQLEQLGTIDILVVPVGGNGYTLDPIGALKLIKAIEPKIVIPTHYDDGSANYPVPQQTLADALKNLAMEPRETVSKLKVKAGEMGETTQLVVLERQ